MQKKLMLGLVTFAMAAIAYWILSSADNLARSRPEAGSRQAVKDFVSMPPTTQQGQSFGDAGIAINPGENTLARVYDEISGRLKYQFEARTWEPINDSEFALQDVLIRIFSPKGEITYISADKAQVTLAKKSKNRLDPKRGWLRENVRVVIDRTTAEWREANPDLAARDAHPDELINIDLQEAKFDLDEAELSTDGAIVVDSREARMENLEGLRLQWNQLDNRIDVLTFKHGGRMELRRGGGFVDFGMPGTGRSAESPEEAAAAHANGIGMPAGPSEHEGADRAELPRAQAMKPMTISAVTAAEAAAEVRAEGGIVTANRPRALNVTPAGPSEPGQLRSPEALAADMEALKTEARAAKPAAGSSVQAGGDPANLADKRLHTYAAVFQNKVVIEQTGGKGSARLEADKLELNFDFGEKLKDMTRGPTRSRPAGAATTQPAADQANERRTDEPADRPAFAGDETRLVLTWDGPLEMRPMRVDPTQQTGQRFDAIATGNPVRVDSQMPASEDPKKPDANRREERRGSARCAQLVFRNERGQVWLSGTEQEPVELTVDETSRLVGREVFFDRRRGLARVDGPGTMRKMPREELPGLSDDTTARQAIAERKVRPAEIRWSRGVDIELGKRVVQKMNPNTGLMEDKLTDYLQRAWFHGDAFIKQGDSQLTGDEVAATFGPPISNSNPVDNIQHLDTSGAVQLTNGKDLICGERINVELTLTPDGRNSPKVVDGSGKVLVRQGATEFRAERMHAVLQPLPNDPNKKAPAGGTTTFSDSRVGIETLEAYGKVYVWDPDRNLKIRDAETLTCIMHPGNQPSKATIVGGGGPIPARLRYGDMAIHGQRIDIDMDAEAVDVPGPGNAWTVSQTDFIGQKQAKASPVKISWTEKMQFRMAKSYGLFIGRVHARSQTFTLDSDKLTVRFGKAPVVKEPKTSRSGDVFRRLEDLVKAQPGARWLVERMIGEDAPTKLEFAAVVGDKVGLKTITAALSGSQREAKPPEAVIPGRQRNQPVAVVADGNAQALSSTYTPSTPEGKRGRLLNRLHIAGDRIVADLQREQMSVPGAGSLLIEDYQFEPKEGVVKLAAVGQRTDPLMSSMRDEGPSQTVVTWENSMDFFRDRALVAFDKNVFMVHRSGQQVVLKGELAKAMQVDAEAMKKLKPGRKASLECGYLLLEFMSSKKPKDSSAGAPLVRATDLQRLIAKHAVRLQEGTKSLMGAHLQYLQEANEIRLEGSQNIEARIFDEDEASQRFNMWRGPLLIWNRQNNRIEAPGATIRASRD